MSNRSTNSNLLMVSKVCNFLYLTQVFCRGPFRCISCHCFFYDTCMCLMFTAFDLLTDLFHLFVLLITTHFASECVPTAHFRDEDAAPKKDGFDQLFELNPDKVNDVKQAMLNFVNKQLVNLSLTVTDLETQFADGVILLLLIGQLEGYFINLSKFFLTPQSQEDKLHNVSLALDLLLDGGILQNPFDPTEIVNGDLKTTLRALYSLFLKHKKASKPS